MRREVVSGQQRSPFGLRSILPLDPEASLPDSSLSQAGGGNSILGLFLAPLDALLQGGHPTWVSGEEVTQTAPPQSQVSAGHKITHSEVLGHTKKWSGGTNWGAPRQMLSQGPTRAPIPALTWERGSLF